MKLLRVVKSHDPDKKFDAVFETDTGRQKIVSFGSRGMDDYTLTGDKEQRERYRTRHAKDLETGDPTRAGYLSYYILWNKPTIQESIKDYRRRFNL
jgi:hypothetical protein